MYLLLVVYYAVAIYYDKKNKASSDLACVGFDWTGQSMLQLNNMLFYFGLCSALARAGQKYTFMVGWWLGVREDGNAREMESSWDGIATLEM